MGFSVRLITPDRVVWDSVVEELILPTTTGQVGILKNHAPLITDLDIGVLRFKTRNESGESSWNSMVLMEGLAIVENNHVKILSNSVEYGSTIDLEIAREELRKTVLLAGGVLEDESRTGKERIETSTKIRKAKVRLMAAMYSC